MSRKVPRLVYPENGRIDRSTGLLSEEVGTLAVMHELLKSFGMGGE